MIRHSHNGRCAVCYAAHIGLYRAAGRIPEGSRPDSVAVLSLRVAATVARTILRDHMATHPNRRAA